jgi:DNA-directed RNA polymerase subunit L
MKIDIQFEQDLDSAKNEIRAIREDVEHIRDLCDEVVEKIEEIENNN